MTLGSARRSRLEAINDEAPKYGRIKHVEKMAFGPFLSIDRFQMENGLMILLCIDRSAPVIAYHTWFRVGSRHEHPGKTGLAHLFEHLMFNEVEGLPAGAFDELMEQAGAENNASTWLDFTQYQETFPKSHLPLIVDLESRRMNRLVLRDPQVDSEKEVVENERRFRVEDDVLGAADELLWKTAFQEHPYHWPTIGWMEDIRSFTTVDCEQFYRTYYAPNNASVILVGDLSESKTLRLLSQAYGPIPPSSLPVEDIQPEPPQTAERRGELAQPTATEKLSIGYKGPALADGDHVPMCVLLEILTGGRASRLFRALISDSQVASEVRGHVGPHRDPSLVEVFASARENHTAEDLLRIVDPIIGETLEKPVTVQEIQRAVARSELELTSGMESADGKAGTIGFFECVLENPSEAFTRLERMRSVTPSDVLRVARRYLRPEFRTVIAVRREQS